MRISLFVMLLLLFSLSLVIVPSFAQYPPRVDALDVPIGWYVVWGTDPWIQAVNDNILNDEYGRLNNTYATFMTQGLANETVQVHDYYDGAMDLRLALGVGATSFADEPNKFNKLGTDGGFIVHRTARHQPDVFRQTKGW